MKKVVFLFSLSTLIVCLVLAAITDHRWEDWYITFRASKNLALGNGLVYNPGELLMTYTSPIGTLIPALLKYIFLNFSDDVVIWGYRIICAIILAVVPYFLIKTLDRLAVAGTTIFFALVCFVFNFLIIDNTINGMESGFMVFFMSYLLYILITEPKNFVFHLSICFAGLMYTRPDGFIYGGAIVFAFCLFNKNIAGLSRTEFLKPLAKALIISILLFAPWFLWTWHYYGTPIPHTIIAKSRYVDLRYLIATAFYFVTSYQGLRELFMPPNFDFGEWESLSYIPQFLSLLTSLYWINIKGNIRARSISFATFIMIIYLKCLSGQGAMTWYLPSVTLPSIVVLVLAFQDLLLFLQGRKKIPGKIFVYPLAIFISLYFMSSFVFATVQIKFQQEIIESGNRKQIGLWLKNNSGKGETVFMECLGYIGFYSEMKTLDFPGMSSPEVVAARKQLGTNNFSALIDHLRPDWLVLRPGEIEKINLENPVLLKNDYSVVKVFDRTDDVNKENLMFGKWYPYFDSHFTIYKKQ